jgi:DNA-binding IclR family transcriptional regulator
VSDQPIYGGDGHGSSNSRVLVAFQPLPDRREMPLQERHRMYDPDIREAMAMAAKKLNQEALKYSAQGFTWDLYSITYDIAKIGGPNEAIPTVIATIKIDRG